MLVRPKIQNININNWEMVLGYLLRQVEWIKVHLDINWDGRNKLCMFLMRKIKHFWTRAPVKKMPY